MFPIKFIPDVKDMLGELSTEEYNFLKEDIEKNNIHSPLSVGIPKEANFHCSYCMLTVVPKMIYHSDGTYEVFCTRCGKEIYEVTKELEKCYLLDGHARWEIAQELSLPKVIFDFIYFDDFDKALAWTGQKHFSHRNMTKNRKKYVLGFIVNTILKDSNRNAVVYAVKNGHNEVKVGYSANLRNLRKRIKQLSYASSTPISFLFYVKGNRDFESRMHGHLRPYHLHGEWYKPECLAELKKKLNNEKKELFLLDGLEKDPDAIERLQTWREELKEALCYISNETKLNWYQIWAKCCYEIHHDYGFPLVDLKVFPDRNYMDTIERTRNFPILSAILGLMIKRNDWEHIRNSIIRENRSYPGIDDSMHITEL